MTAEFDLPAIAQRLSDLGLMDKPFKDLSRDEVLGLCLAVYAGTKRRSLQPIPSGVPGASQDPGVSSRP